MNTTENAIYATNNQEIIEALVNNSDDNDNEQLVDGLTNEREIKTGPEEVNKIAKTRLSRAAKEKKFCNKSLTQKEHLKKHSKIQNKSDNQAESNKSIATTSSTANTNNLTCNKCGKQFSNEWNLKQHLKIHTGVKEFKCTKCKYETKHSGDLVKHMRRHSHLSP